jgi:pimeloyl-ACP methyl ester carboxylesterase
MKDLDKSVNIGRTVGARPRRATLPVRQFRNDLAPPAFPAGPCSLGTLAYTMQWFGHLAARGMGVTFRCCSGLLVAMLLVSGCASLHAPPPPPPSVITPQTRGVVFVVNGAGGYYGPSNALREAIDQQGIPLAVEPFVWTHGYGRVLADQTDLAHLQEQGRRLAEQIVCWRQHFPGHAVYLVGHSAGSGVALECTRHLGPGSIDRIVLLAPAVSAEYDVRPALACVRLGLDVFHSSRDWGYLGVATGVIGTTDRRWSAAAGRVGFRPGPVCLQDAALYAKLRQHPWHPCLEWTGNEGGHYGTYRPIYLRAFVLPLFSS